MHEPGARVVGHRALVRQPLPDRWRVDCTCGYESSLTSDDSWACLRLVLHLEKVVREGARVVGGDDGLAGVREPRRPFPPDDALHAALDIA